LVAGEAQLQTERTWKERQYKSVCVCECARVGGGLRSRERDYGLKAIGIISDKSIKAERRMRTYSDIIQERPELQQKQQNTTRSGLVGREAFGEQRKYEYVRECEYKGKVSTALHSSVDRESGGGEDPSSHSLTIESLLLVAGRLCFPPSLFSSLSCRCAHQCGYSDREPTSRTGKPAPRLDPLRAASGAQRPLNLNSARASFC
jgi:hypothetical protein